MKLVGREGEIMEPADGSIDQRDGSIGISSYVSRSMDAEGAVDYTRIGFGRVDAGVALPRGRGRLRRRVSPGLKDQMN